MYIKTYILNQWLAILYQISLHSSGKKKKEKKNQSGMCGLKTDQMPTIVAMLLNATLKYFILEDYKTYF